MHAAVGFVQGDGPGFDGDGPHPVDGVLRVDDQIRQDLVELRGVHPDRPHLVPRPPDQLDVLADEAPQHLEQTRHRVVEIDHPRIDGLLAGEGQQLARQLGRTFGRRLDVDQVGVKRVAGVDLLQGGFGMAEDGAQHGC